MSKFFGDHRWGYARILMFPDPAPGGGGPNPPAPAPNPPAPAPAPAPDLATLAARLEKLEKENAELRAKPPTPPAQDNETLAQKAERERKESENRMAGQKEMERALTFNMQAPTFVKDNAFLLPQTVPGILAAAEKENWSSPMEKEQAIKSELITEFFAQQANLDLLTASQKLALEEFKKLTKADRAAKASQIYDSIFEPTFETLRKVKRAEQVSRGYKDQGNVETAYMDRLQKGARKTYLKEKQ